MKVQLLRFGQKEFSFDSFLCSIQHECSFLFFALICATMHIVARKTEWVNFVAMRGHSPSNLNNFCESKTVTSHKILKCFDHQSGCH
jgi:hypothetical protein